MNVSGHRLSTAEIESSLVAHPWTAEAAVVGASRRDHRPGGRRVRHPQGQPGRARAPTADGARGAARARRPADRRRSPGPAQVFIVNELPKTRSGKIMRRLLRDLAEGREIGDTTTLADTSVMRSSASRSEQPLHAGSANDGCRGGIVPAAASVVLRASARELRELDHELDLDRRVERQHRRRPPRERAWRPASPKISPSTSDAPLMTPGWPVNAGSDATKPTTFTMRVTRSSEPISRAHRGERVERARAGVRLGVVGGDEPVAVADLAGRGQRARDEGQLAGGVDEVPVTTAGT